MLLALKSPPKTITILKEVRAATGVEEAEMVYGVYDIVAKVKKEKLWTNSNKS